ncbi:hypothetical protein KAS45_06060, partial [candidate division WOR-3 bacterium]|nr:hypothetical protein [candidate division WOR-3 bacterium]
MKGFGSTVFKAVFRNVYEKIDVKIAVSESARRTNEFYIPGTYHIVSPGVDIKRFTPEGQDFASMRGNTLLFVGRMDSRKGLHR